MKNRPIQILLVTAISLVILISFTYQQYYIVASADFISLDLKLENFDHDYLSAVDQNELKMSASGTFFEGFHLSCLFEQSFHLLSPILSLHQKDLVLRC